MTFTEGLRNHVNNHAGMAVASVNLSGSLAAIVAANDPGKDEKIDQFINALSLTVIESMTQMEGDNAVTYVMRQAQAQMVADMTVGLFLAQMVAFGVPSEDAETLAVEVIGSVMAAAEMHTLMVEADRLDLPFDPRRDDEDYDL